MKHEVNLPDLKYLNVRYGLQISKEELEEMTDKLAKYLTGFERLINKSIVETAGNDEDRYGEFKSALADLRHKHELQWNVRINVAKHPGFYYYHHHTGYYNTYDKETIKLSVGEATIELSVTSLISEKRKKKDQQIYSFTNRNYKGEEKKVNLKRPLFPLLIRVLDLRTGKYIKSKTLKKDNFVEVLEWLETEIPKAVVRKMGYV